MLLAFDTSSAAVTVAVADPASGEVVASSSVVDALRHGELLAPAIAAALDAAGLTVAGLSRIAVGVGPGPFTGLRVGLVTALTMADLLRIPVQGVCSLDLIAAEVSGPVVVATDARRKEVYWAVYDASGRRLEGPAVDKPAAVAHTLPALPIVGRGASLYPELRAGRATGGQQDVPAGPDYPSAAVLAAGVLDGSLELVAPEPRYLRRPDVTPSSAPKSVLPR